VNCQQRELAVQRAHPAPDCHLDAHVSTLAMRSVIHWWLFICANGGLVVE